MISSKFKTILSVLIFVSTATVQASVITINYTGEVVSVGSGLTSEFNVGDSVSGNVNYNTTGSVFYPTATAAFYSGSLGSFTMNIGGYTATADGLNGSVSVYDDNQAGSSAPLRDTLTFADYDGLSGNDVGGYSLVRLQLGMMTTVLTTLTSLNLPTIADLLAMFAANQDTVGNISFMAFTGGQNVRYRITSLTATISGDTGAGGNPVPEPGTLLLLATGLLGLGAKKLNPCN